MSEILLVVLCLAIGVALTSAGILLVYVAREIRRAEATPVPERSE